MIMRRPTPRRVVVCAALCALGETAFAATAYGAESGDSARQTTPEKPKNTTSSTTKSSAPPRKPKAAAEKKGSREASSAKPASPPKDPGPSRVGDDPDDQGFRVIESD